MKTELYEAILDQLFETLGYKCQPSELEELAQVLLDIVRETLSDELY